MDAIHPHASPNNATTHSVLNSRQEATKIAAVSRKSDESSFSLDGDKPCL
jgi:hypothetical protein